MSAALTSHKPNTVAADSEPIRLSERDSERLLVAVFETDSEPNENLRKLATRYHDAVRTGRLKTTA